MAEKDHLLREGWSFLLLTNEVFLITFNPVGIRSKSR